MIRKPRPTTKPASPRKILSVPLPLDMHARLEERAGRQPLSAYVRDQLFPANDNEAPRKTARSRSSVKDAAALAGALALLGPVSTALKSLAHASASGLLPFAPDTEAAVLKACADIAEIKALLVKALGIRER